MRAIPEKIPDIWPPNNNNTTIPCISVLRPPITSTNLTFQKNNWMGTKYPQAKQFQIVQTLPSSRYHNDISLTCNAQPFCCQTNGDDQELFHKCNADRVQVVEPFTEVRSKTLNALHRNALNSDAQANATKIIDRDFQKATEKPNKYNKSDKVQDNTGVSSGRKPHSSSNLEDKKKQKAANHYRRPSPKPPMEKIGKSNEVFYLKGNSIVAVNTREEVTPEQLARSAKKPNDSIVSKSVTRNKEISFQTHINGHRCEPLTKDTRRSNLVIEGAPKLLGTNNEALNKNKLNSSEASSITNYSPNTETFKLNDPSVQVGVSPLYCEEKTIPFTTLSCTSSLGESKQDDKDLKTSKTSKVSIAEELACPMLGLVKTLHGLVKGDKGYSFSFETLDSTTRTNLLSALERRLSYIPGTQRDETLSPLKHQGAERQVLVSRANNHSIFDENQLFATQPAANLLQERPINDCVSNHVVDLLRQIIEDENKKHLNLLCSCLEQQAIGRSAIEQLYSCLRERNKHADRSTRRAPCTLYDNPFANFDGTFCGLPDGKLLPVASCTSNKISNGTKKAEEYSRNYWRDRIGLDYSFLSKVSHYDENQNLSDRNKRKFWPSIQRLTSKITTQASSVKPLCTSVTRNVDGDMNQAMCKEFLRKHVSKRQNLDTSAGRNSEKHRNNRSHLLQRHCFREKKVVCKGALSQRVGTDVFGELKQAKWMTLDEIRKHNEEKLRGAQKKHIRSMSQQDVNYNELAPLSKGVSGIGKEDTIEARDGIMNTALTRQQQLPLREERTPSAFQKRESGVCSIHTHSFLIETFSEINGNPISVALREVQAIIVYENPDIVAMPKFLTVQECEDLIKEANINGWEKSKTSKGLASASEESYTSGEGPSRTSSSSRLKQGASKLVNRIGKRVAAASQCSFDSIESLVVVRYFPGEFFKAHYDGFFRPKTVLIYLTEVEDGGETEFVELGFKVKPQQGTAVMWSNTAEDGTPDYRMLHAGLPPKSGIKYVVNCFINKDRQSILDKATALLDDTSNTKKQSLFTPDYSRSTDLSFSHYLEKCKSVPFTSFSNAEGRFNEKIESERFLSGAKNHSGFLISDIPQELKNFSQLQETCPYKYQTTLRSQEQLECFSKSACAVSSQAEELYQLENDSIKFANLMEYHRWLKHQENINSFTTQESKKPDEVNEYSNAYS